MTLERKIRITLPSLGEPYEWIYQEILCTLKQIHPCHIDQISFQDQKRNYLGAMVPAVQTYQLQASDEVHLNHLKKSNILKEFDPARVVWMIFTSEEVRVEKSIMVWRKVK